jgi:hypothetical protein
LLAAKYGFWILGLVFATRAPYTEVMKLTETEKTNPFPLDWKHWNALWLRWMEDDRGQGLIWASRVTGTVTGATPFRGKNLMADTVRFVGKLPKEAVTKDRGPWVELSEVTFSWDSKTSRETLRFVGIAMATEDGITFTPEDCVVDCFQQLEVALFGE